MTLRWLDLYAGDDTHPRRFDRLETAVDYLRRIERLSDEAIDTLTRTGQVEPPLARRPYRLRGAGR